MDKDKKKDKKEKDKDKENDKEKDKDKKKDKDKNNKDSVATETKPLPPTKPNAKPEAKKDIKIVKDHYVYIRHILKFEDGTQEDKEIEAVIGLNRIGLENEKIADALNIKIEKVLQILDNQNK